MRMPKNYCCVIIGQAMCANCVVLFSEVRSYAIITKFARKICPNRYGQPRRVPASISMKSSSICICPLKGSTCGSSWERSSKHLSSRHWSVVAAIKCVPPRYCTFRAINCAIVCLPLENGGFQRPPALFPVQKDSFLWLYGHLLSFGKLLFFSKWAEKCLCPLEEKTNILV